MASTMTPSEIMIARNIRLVFNKLIFNKEKVKCMAQKTGNKFLGSRWKGFYQIYQMGKKYWEVRTIIKRICRMIYLVKGPKMIQVPFGHLTKSKHTDKENAIPVDIESMEVLWHIWCAHSLESSDKTKKKTKREEKEIENQH